MDDAYEECFTTLADYIESHIKGPAPPAGAPRAYLAQYELFEQCPKLRKDIIQPEYVVPLEEDVENQARINAWFGPAGTLTPLHYDIQNNIFAQVVGSKYIRLYRPEEADRLYAYESGPRMGSSRIIDPDNDTDLAVRFPRFADAPYVDLVLQEGECLYIPPRWWHFVESRETSFSVSFWW